MNYWFNEKNYLSQQKFLSYSNFANITLRTFICRMMVMWVLNLEKIKILLCHKMQVGVT